MFFFANMDRLVIIKLKKTPQIPTKSVIINFELNEFAVKVDF